MTPPLDKHGVEITNGCKVMAKRIGFRTARLWLVSHRYGEKNGLYVWDQGLETFRIEGTDRYDVEVVS